LFDERGDRLVDWRAAGSVRVRPLLRHQSAVPPHNRVGCDQTVPSQSTRQLSDQRGEVRAVGPGKARLGVRAAQHRYLVPQNEQLDVLGGGGTAEEHAPAEQPGEDQIE